MEQSDLNGVKQTKKELLCKTIMCEEIRVGQPSQAVALDTAASGKRVSVQPTRWQGVLGSAS